MHSLANPRLRRAYYRLKPFVPRKLRWALRRRQARSILKRSADIWPINEAAGATPDGWPGWPDGKQFAFVLTHDVETQGGLDKVRPLAELEMELGFRSSFNFVPEGEYEVPDDLLAWLRENGFEIGVHDLHHDGKLFNSRRAFRKKAERINHYLEKWGAVGFRGAFMLRELDWLHDLDLQYDASTFDTDPFEPQPDGASTIFPHWTQNGGETGYVELPYTLPQDSTLFLLLKESTTAIWRAKMDWVAERGGMALMISHPDYIATSGGTARRNEYPIARYAEFLQWTKRTYPERSWLALPREISKFWRTLTARSHVSSIPDRRNSKLYDVHELSASQRRP